MREYVDELAAERRATYLTACLRRELNSIVTAYTGNCENV
jgi:hypothetical protein